jgi:hypothetical protein
MSSTTTAAASPHPAHRPPAATHPPLPRRVLRHWLAQGLRSAFFLRPRTAGRQAAPWQLLLVVLFTMALEAGLGRLSIDGPADFDLRGLLIPWWTAAASALLAWMVLWRAPVPDAGERPPGLGTFLLLWWIAVLPVVLVGHGLSIAQEHELLPAALLQSQVAPWVLYVGLQAWPVGIAIFLGAAFGLRRARLLALGLGVAGIAALAAWHFGDRAWDRVPEAPGPRFSLRQETFEAQQALWQQQAAALAPGRPGVVDVYGLVFSPYADEDVFLRENHLVAGVLRDRFEAQGRVLQLVNHATTATTLPWATPPNLRRAVDALAQRMDRDEDVLVVYLTSHGASNHRLAARHWPLEVDWLQPADLRQALDGAGIRHRVIAVSACYSGGWVDPLAGDATLVMTAADAQHTSYGCGRKSELTFFGRALFDEQLRTTRSFETAFAAAVPVIRRREEEAGKPDGFSNPQIRVGSAIRPVLEGLALRLEQAPAR